MKFSFLWVSNISFPVVVDLAAIELGYVGGSQSTIVAEIDD